MKNTTSEKMYQFLLKLYPTSYRKGYEDSMRQLFRDLYNEAKTEGFPGLLVLWLHLFFIDFIPTLIIQHLDKENIEQYLEGGESMKKELFWRSSSFLFIPGFLFAGVAFGLYFEGEPMAAGATGGLGLGMIALAISFMKR